MTQVGLSRGQRERCPCFAVDRLLCSHLAKGHTYYVDLRGSACCPCLDGIPKSCAGAVAFQTTHRLVARHGRWDVVMASHGTAMHCTSGGVALSANAARSTRLKLPRWGSKVFLNRPQTRKQFLEPCPKLTIPQFLTFYACNLVTSCEISSSIFELPELLKLVQLCMSNLCQGTAAPCHLEP